ncbi:pentapeptide repeat-containing protein [Dapis sp. BLCC M172]|uniref:pentapeptide repeat-containing protein n=1 Tax=Dapis sp. BLCC M172 TaxID=2975281 RepID=UPI003CF97732
MANTEQLEILRKGIDTWNQWRKQQRDVQVDLSEANLSEANLSGANLREANLREANLREANLSGANLSRASLNYGSNLSQANLIGINLSQANLSGINLSQANLSGANLREAHLSRANLSGANLGKVDLSKVVFSQANLSGANLSQADLSEADLSRANLSEADLSRANLSEADLSRADLSRANLSEANLSEANLSGANLSGANLKEVNFKGADLGKIQLKSQIGVDYNLLQELLSQGRWKQADQETERILRQISGCQEKTNIDKILNPKITYAETPTPIFRGRPDSVMPDGMTTSIPDEDLKAIYSLWIKYSNESSDFSIGSLDFWVSLKTALEHIWDQDKALRYAYDLQEYSVNYADSAYCHD